VKHVVIKAPSVWKTGNPRGLYAVPRIEALEALYWFVYNAHFTWFGLGQIKVPDYRTIGQRWSLAECNTQTVVCHGRLLADAKSQHTDGWFQEAYVSARWSGMSPSAALYALLELHGGIVSLNGVNIDSVLNPRST